MLRTIMKQFVSEMILSGSPFEQLDYSYPEPANKSARFFVDIDLNELRAWGAARPFVAPLMAAEAAAADTMVLLMGSLTWFRSIYLIRYSALLIWVSFSKNPKYKVVGWAHICLHIHLNSPRFSVPAVSDTNIDVVISHTSSSLSNQNARKNLNHWPSSQSLNCFTLLPNHKQDNIYVFRNSQI